MAPNPLAQLGHRLEIAIKAKGLSKRKFQRIMAQRETPGSSYPSIARYYKGVHYPALEFIIAAANLCECDPSWLAFGEARSEPHRDSIAFTEVQDGILTVRIALSSLPKTRR